MPAEARDLILAGAIISIILNPLMFFLCDTIRPFLEIWSGRNIPKPTPAPRDEIAGEAGADTAAETAQKPEATKAEDSDDDIARRRPTALQGHTIVVGFGRVGNLVARKLKESGTPFLVIEDADKRVEEMKGEGIEFVSGNAADPAVLALANLAGASTIIVAIPDAFEAGQVTEQARAANASMRIVGRAHSDAEVEHLLHFGADTVIMGEREIAREMIASLQPKPV